MSHWPSWNVNSGDGSAGSSGSCRGLGARLLLLVIEAYRMTLSPLFLGACRFEPSCSRFASEAIARHGASRGLGMALRRLLRCHPFGAGGVDPVP